MHRSSPLRSTLNRNGITGLDMCTDAVHLRSTLNSNVITGVDTVKNFNPPVAKAINELPRYLERLRVHPTSLLFFVTAPRTSFGTFVALVVTVLVIPVLPKMPGVNFTKYSNQE